LALAASAGGLRLEPWFADSRFCKAGDGLINSGRWTCPGKDGRVYVGYFVTISCENACKSSGVLLVSVSDNRGWVQDTYSIHLQMKCIPWNLTSGKLKYRRMTLRVCSISSRPPKDTNIVFHTTSKSWAPFR
jgi:hypothetical protein